ncbi:MAG TPA: hypothetical protein PK318_13420 [Accumulibacter sp.]|nr:hypothetical protein [Accumulibacter sp.]
MSLEFDASGYLKPWIRHFQENHEHPLAASIGRSTDLTLVLKRALAGTSGCTSTVVPRAIWLKASPGKTK